MRNVTTTEEKFEEAAKRAGWIRRPGAFWNEGEVKNQNWKKRTVATWQQLCEEEGIEVNRE